jgi:hypothetical protein
VAASLRRIRDNGEKQEFATNPFSIMRPGGSRPIEWFGTNLARRLRQIDFATSSMERDLNDLLSDIAEIEKVADCRRIGSEINERGGSVKGDSAPNEGIARLADGLTRRAEVCAGQDGRQRTNRAYDGCAFRIRIRLLALQRGGPPIEWSASTNAWEAIAVVDGRYTDWAGHSVGKPPILWGLIVRRRYLVAHRPDTEHRRLIVYIRMCEMARKIKSYKERHDLSPADKHFPMAFLPELQRVAEQELRRAAWAAGRRPGPVRGLSGNAAQENMQCARLTDDCSSEARHPVGSGRRSIE